MSTIESQLAAKVGCSPSDISDVQQVGETREVIGNRVHIIRTYRYKVAKKFESEEQRLAHFQKVVEEAIEQHPQQMSDAWLAGESIPWKEMGLPDLPSQGPFSILSTTAGLSAHEEVRLRSKKKSHAIEKHVDPSLEKIVKEMQASKKENKNWTTRFYDREIAELAISVVLNHYRSDIRDWCNNPDAGTRFLQIRKVDLGVAIGHGACRRDSIVVTSDAITRVNVILEKTRAKNGLPFTIVTAYPAAERE